MEREGGSNKLYQILREHYLSIRLSIHFFHLISIYLIIFHSIYLSVHLSIYLPLPPPLYLSIYLSLPPPLYLSIYLPLPPPLYLSFSLSVWQLVQNKSVEGHWYMRDRWENRHYRDKVGKIETNFCGYNRPTVEPTYSPTDLQFIRPINSTDLQSNGTAVQPNYSLTKLQFIWSIIQQTYSSTKLQYNRRK